MIRKNTNNFVSIAEVVYYNPDANIHGPIRLDIQVDLSETSSMHKFDLPNWLEVHRDQISKSIFKASKNSTGESKFRFVRVKKIPFYSKVI